jgi:hypothetical protein
MNQINKGGNIMKTRIIDVAKYPGAKFIDISVRVKNTTSYGDRFYLDGADSREELLDVIKYRFDRLFDIKLTAGDMVQLVNKIWG